MKPVVAIAISGGVDSLVAAYLLKAQGCQPQGIHFITGFESTENHAQRSMQNPAAPEMRLTDCRQARGDFSTHPVMRIGKQLDIPIHFVDCSDVFRATVVDYFCHTYAAGRTPNPCLVCNPAIKFGAVLAYAQKIGATALATGHYAQVKQDKNGHYHLLKGVDARKDQSYFLSFLTPSQLARAMFPLGNMTKESVRELAHKNRLSPSVREESQDICFIRGQSYGEFLSRWGNVDHEPGPIADVHGNIIGEHPGLHLFTIGQRKGINCPASEPYYVLRINPAQNRLTVGFRQHLAADSCRVDNINWIQPPDGSRFEAETRLRYRHQAAPSTIVPHDDGRIARVNFRAPQTAVTPGQGAVFYRGQEVLGGGWITHE